MPFKSKAQQGFLSARHPQIAKEFGRSMSADDFKRLPDRASDVPPDKKLYRASDIKVKENIKSAAEEVDKFVRSGVLQELIADLDELDFDSKMKPKVAQEEMPMEEAPVEEAPMEELPIPEGTETEEEEMPDEEENPKFMALLRKYKKGA